MKVGHEKCAFNSQVHNEEPYDQDFRSVYFHQVKDHQHGGHQHGNGYGQAVCSFHVGRFLKIQDDKTAGYEKKPVDQGNIHLSAILGRIADFDLRPEIQGDSLAYDSVGT